MVRMMVLGLCVPLAPLVYVALLQMLTDPQGQRLVLPRLFLATSLGIVAFVLPRPLRTSVRVAAFTLAFVGPLEVSLLTPTGAARWTEELVRARRLQPVLIASSAAGVVLLTPAFVLLGMRRHRQAARQASAHGSARWATARDLNDASLLSREGIVLGQIQHVGRRERIIDGSDHHVLLVMPPGAGKTTGPVISTLLNTPSTALILDPKAELWTSTAGWRAKIGHRCIRFSPTTSSEPAWNPLDSVERGSGEIAEVATLARNLVSASAESGGDSHWILSARALFVGLALHLIYDDDEPATLARMRELLAHDPEELFAEDLEQAVHDPCEEQGWRDERGESIATHPEVLRCARRFRSTPERERGSIISTLATYLDLWADPTVSAATSHSDFDLRAILSSGCPTSLYVTIPYHDLPRTAPLLRLWLAAVAQGITSRRPEKAERVEIVLDEFAALGRLPVIEDILAFMRGYGARATLVVQDLRQIVRLYGRGESITGNCQVHAAGATQQPETREHFSRLSGVATVQVPNRSVSGSALGRRQVTRSVSIIQRPLLTAGEIGALPEDELLILKRGFPPARIKRLRFFEDPELVARSKIPPPTP